LVLDFPFLPVSCRRGASLSSVLGTTEIRLTVFYFLSASGNDNLLSLGLPLCRITKDHCKRFILYL
jgi:hypothetical protein